MDLGIGCPSNYNVTGVSKRIEKMNQIMQIPKGLNLDLGTGIGAYYNDLLKYSEKLIAFDGDINYLHKFKEINESYSSNISH